MAECSSTDDEHLGLVCLYVGVRRHYVLVERRPDGLDTCPVGGGVTVMECDIPDEYFMGEDVGVAYTAEQAGAIVADRVEGFLSEALRQAGIEPGVDTTGMVLDTANNDAFDDDVDCEYLVSMIAYLRGAPELDAVGIPYMPWDAFGEGMQARLHGPRWVYTLPGEPAGHYEVLHRDDLTHNLTGQPGSAAPDAKTGIAL